MDTLNAAPQARTVINEHEAAHRCNVSIVTMRRHRYGNTGPTFLRLTERRIGYRVCDVEAWLDSRRSRAA